MWVGAVKGDGTTSAARKISGGESRCTFRSERGVVENSFSGVHRLEVERDEERVWISFDPFTDEIEY